MTYSKMLLDFFNKQSLTTTLGYLELAKGTIDGHTCKHIFGYSENIGTVYETVWDGSGIYPYPTVASQLSVQSSSTNDVYSTGTGAWMIVIFGLDADYNEIMEYVQLNGTNVVITANSYLRVTQMIVAMTGSAQTAAGIITAKISGNTVAQINVGNNITLMGVFTVPAGWTAYITHGQSSTGSGKEAAGIFTVRQFNTAPGMFVAAHIFNLYKNNYEYRFEPPIAMPEKTDLEVRAKTSRGTVPISTGFDIILVSG